MQVRTNRHLLAAATLLFCSACNADSEPEAALTTSLKTHSSKVSDAASPVGYWTRESSYPHFTGVGGASEVARRLNHRVEQLREQYTCADGGDQSFSAAVETLEKALVSMSYTAMWHCSSMPSPESTDGALNLKLPSLEELALKPYLPDQSQQPFFATQAETLSTEKIRQRVKDERCAFSDWDYFTVEPDVIVLHFRRNSSPDCDTNITFPRSELKGLVPKDGVLLK